MLRKEYICCDLNCICEYCERSIAPVSPPNHLSRILLFFLCLFKSGFSALFRSLPLFTLSFPYLCITLSFLISPILPCFLFLPHVLKLLQPMADCCRYRLISYKSCLSDQLPYRDQTDRKTHMRGG